MLRSIATAPKLGMSLIRFENGHNLSDVRSFCKSFPEARRKNLHLEVLLWPGLSGQRTIYDGPMSEFSLLCLTSLDIMRVQLAEISHRIRQAQNQSVRDRLFLHRADLHARFVGAGGSIHEDVWNGERLQPPDA